MNVVLVSGSLPEMRCGIGDYTARLAAELANVPDVSVTVITSENKRVRLDGAAAAKVLATGRWGIGSLAGLFRSIVRLRPDVVHLQYPAVGYDRALGIVMLPIALRWWAHVPVVLTIHERRERRRGARFAIDLMARSSREVIVFDPIEAAELKRSLGRFAPPVSTGVMISTIPVLTPVDRTAWRARLGAVAEDIVVASFGLLHPRRRLEDIIDAIAELRRALTPARLLIVGGEAEYDPDAAREYSVALHQRVSTLGLEAATNWLDHVDPETVSATLQASDLAVLLYPGGASGRNTTLQAALEHGLPVVTTIGPATPETIREETGVTFVPAGASERGDLAKAMLAALKQGANRSKRSSRLPEHVAFHLRLYRRLLE